MSVPDSVIAEFVDACVVDQRRAEAILQSHSALRTSAWRNEPILTFLVIESWLEGVRFCLEHGFDVSTAHDREAGEPIHFACLQDDREMVELLLRHGADSNAPSAVDDVPLHCCVTHGYAELVGCLLNHGADPKYVTDLGKTIYDDWPNKPEKQAELKAVLAQFGLSSSDG